MSLRKICLCYTDRVIQRSNRDHKERINYMQTTAGKLFLISASSGAGKTTLVHEVITRIKPTHSLQRVITYTTKTPRPGEMLGVDYHFLTETDFLQKIDQNFFVIIQLRFYGVNNGLL